MAAELKQSEHDDECSFSFQLRNVPNDHSCLFHSIGYLLNHDEYSKDANYHFELRKIVSIKIVEDAELYKHQLIGSDGDIPTDPEEYSKWIMDEFSWGGTLEIAILAKYYKINIVVIDVTANQFMVMQGGGGDASNDSDDDNDNDGNNRIHIVYNGDHYDAVVGVLKGNGELDVGKEIRLFTLQGMQQMNWSGIEQQQMKEFMTEEHEKWMKKKETLDKLKRGKKWKCKDCGKICGSNQEMENHMTETEFECCFFDEVS